MRPVTSFGTFSGRAVESDLNRAFERYVIGLTRRGASTALLVCLSFTACQTVGLPRRPITVTATAVPADEATEAVGATAPGSTFDRVGSASGLGLETRGLWVVRSTMIHPDSVRAMVARAADAGFNTLLVQVRGRGDAYYSGGIEPRAVEIVDQPIFDPLALAVREAKARGIEVHAWMNVHLISSASVISRDPKHLVNERPGLLAVPLELARELYDVDPASRRYLDRLVAHALANGASVEGLYSSPSAPEVKERVYTIAMDLVERYEIDGIHLDYVRYPNEAFDYSRGALDRFRTWIDGRITADRRTALAAALRQNPLALVEADPDSWAEFRRSQITDLVERIYVGVKRRRPDVLVSAAVFPDARESYASRYQDWEGWLRRGIVDVVAPMAYNANDGLFGEAISRAVEIGGSERVWAGVGAHLTTYEGTLTKIAITRRIGARGFLLFSYDWSVAYGAAAGGRSFLERVGSGAEILSR